MASITSICRFLNKTLNIRKIPDGSRNGLQVKSKNTVKKIGFTVDISISAIEMAKRKKVDLLIVHHGILWKGKRDKTGLKKATIQMLNKYKISLCAYHLPLDLHPIYGNNIILANMLDLLEISKFGTYKRKAIGFKGNLSKPTDRKKVMLLLNNKLQTKCSMLPFGKNRVKSIGIVSGGGDFAITESYKKNVDLLITGEVGHSIYHVAKDLKKNVIMAGHYASETVGVKALMPILREKFDIKTTFIDIPTGM